MMPFQLFIIRIIKKVRNYDMEHQARVVSMMDEAHNKSAQYMNMM